MQRSSSPSPIAIGHCTKWCRPPFFIITVQLEDFRHLWWGCSHMVHANLSDRWSPAGTSSTAQRSCSWSWRCLPAIASVAAWNCCASSITLIPISSAIIAPVLRPISPLPLLLPATLSIARAHETPWIPSFLAAFALLAFAFAIVDIVHLHWSWASIVFSSILQHVEVLQHRLPTRPGSRVLVHHDQLLLQLLVGHPCCSAGVFSSQHRHTSSLLPQPSRLALAFLTLKHTAPALHQSWEDAPWCFCHLQSWNTAWSFDQEFLAVSLEHRAVWVSATHQNRSSCSGNSSLSGLHVLWGMKPRCCRAVGIALLSSHWSNLLPTLPAHHIYSLRSIASWETALSTLRTWSGHPHRSNPVASALSRHLKILTSCLLCSHLVAWETPWRLPYSLQLLLLPLRVPLLSPGCSPPAGDPLLWSHVPHAGFADQSFSPSSLLFAPVELTSKLVHILHHLAVGLDVKILPKPVAKLVDILLDVVKSLQELLFGSFVKVKPRHHPAKSIPKNSEDHHEHGPNPCFLWLLLLWNPPTQWSQSTVPPIHSGLLHDILREVVPIHLDVILLTVASTLLPYFSP